MQVVTSHNTGAGVGGESSNTMLGHLLKTAGNEALLQKIPSLSAGWKPNLHLNLTVSLVT